MGYGTTFAFTAKHDLDYDATRKTITYVTGVEALKQDLKHRLLTIQGEDVLNPSVGLPLQEFIGTGFNRELIESAVREQIEADPRIASVGDITITDPDQNRRIVITAEATAVDGETFNLSVFTEAA